MSNPHFISVIICTHNPRKGVFERVLSALEKQDLPQENWEFIVIDNRSEKPIDANGTVSWHQAGRVVREEEIGVTNARLRGIKESKGAFIIFVDDDNVLDANYLSAAERIFTERPHMAAFGGSLIPEYEVTPPDWSKPYLEYLACSEITQDYWANFDWKWATPCGAGLCIRREVAERYFSEIANNPLRRSLDRSGKKLSSGGDTDLALTATDMNLGIGRFKVLRLTHIIARERLTEDYLIGLYAGIGQCYVILESIRPRYKSPAGSQMAKRLRFIWHFCTDSRIQRKMLLARRRAEAEAIAVLRLAFS
jgi:glycosyltransferase involved in cell wall biosynthesis